MDKQEILKQHISRFVTLTNEELDYFLSHFSEHTYKKGQVIISEGDRVENEYFVLSGYLKSFFINEETKMYILQFAMPSWWTSDYVALYNNTRATINIDCISDAEILSLSNLDREKICSESMQSNASSDGGPTAVISPLSKGCYPSCPEMQKRYEDLMQLYPQLYNVVPKQLIAAYLGVSRETLSRLYSNHKHK